MNKIEIKKERLLWMKKNGYRVNEIWQELGISRDTYYRILKEESENKKLCQRLNRRRFVL